MGASNRPSAQAAQAAQEALTDALETARTQVAEASLAVAQTAAAVVDESEALARAVRRQSQQHMAAVRLPERRDTLPAPPPPPTEEAPDADPASITSRFRALRD